MERDKQLDIYRGLSMIYVVCFIHVTYWLKIGQEPYMSAWLVEMPLIFFISGAALSLNKKPRSFVKTCWSRIKRVVLPFYIYAVVMLAIVALLSVVWHYWLPEITKMFGEKVATKYMFDITSYTWADVRSILTCSDVPQSPCVWHLWFILPYLILSCTFELQKKILTQVNRGGYFCLCIIAFLIAQNCSENFTLRNVLCYNIFMVLGYAYYKQIRRRWIVAAFVCFALLTVGALLFTDVAFSPMQENKFPPNWFFVLYNLMVLCGIALILDRVKIPENKWLLLWNERGYTLYLYQSIVFFVMFAVYMAVIKKIPNQIIQCLASSLCMFVMSTAVSYMAYPLERSVLKRFK